MSRKFIISEEQERKLINRINEETYQMPVDKKMNTPYCINPEKVLIVKKFLDKTFKAHDFEKIGSNGMPIKIKVISINASNGEPLKYMYKDQLHDLLIDRFQNMFLDKNERNLFMKQVIEDWINGNIGIFGNLSKNSLMENKMDEIDSKANEANTNPTEKQKEAGNYKMGHIRIYGMPISIETPKGSYRTYKDKNGVEQKIILKNHYGYFTNTTGQGKDGDAVDVFIGPNVNNFDYVYVIDQNNEKGEFDESKVMLGFNSIKHAKDAYLENFSSDWDGFDKITKVSVKTFKKWLYRKHKQRKPFYQYTYINNFKLNESLDSSNLITEKIAKIHEDGLCVEVMNMLTNKGYQVYEHNNLIYSIIPENSIKTYDDCKNCVKEYIEKYTDLNTTYILDESYLTEENYNQICKIISTDNSDIANEIVDELNRLGVYTYYEDNTIYAVIEQDFIDDYYVEDTVRKCKKIASDMFSNIIPNNI